MKMCLLGIYHTVHKYISISFVMKTAIVTDCLLWARSACLYVWTVRVRMLWPCPSCVYALYMTLCGHRGLLSHTLPHSGARVCRSPADVQQKTRSVSPRLIGVEDLAVLGANGLIYVGTVFIGQCGFSCLAVHFGIFEHISTGKKNM